MAQRHESTYWMKLKHLSVIVSIIAGLATIVSIAWAGLMLIKNGLRASVPSWVLIATAFAAFFLGWIIRLWQTSSNYSTQNEHLYKIGQILFDYMPDKPTAHGWKLNVPEENFEPYFCAAQSAPTPGSLEIKDNGKYSLDYMVNQSESLCNIVGLSTKLIKSSAIYLKARVFSRDKSNSREVWLRHKIGTGKPQKVSDKEWNVPVLGDALDNGWVFLKLNIADEVKETFGLEGWHYGQLIGLRLSGSLLISPITFYRKK